MKELGISAVQDTSLQGYRERVRQRMKERRQAFLERDILGEGPEAKRIEQEGYWEWLGDYPGSRAPSERQELAAAYGTLADL